MRQERSCSETETTGADGPARGAQLAEVAGPLSPAPSAASEQVTGEAGGLRSALLDLLAAVEMPTHGLLSFDFPALKQVFKGAWDCKVHGRNYSGFCICCSNNRDRAQEDHDASLRYERNRALESAAINARVALAKPDFLRTTIRALKADRACLLAALQPIANAISNDPGTSDLDDDQPVSIRLGYVRKVWRAIFRAARS